MGRGSGSGEVDGGSRTNSKFLSATLFNFWPPLIIETDRQTDRRIVADRVVDRGRGNRCTI